MELALVDRWKSLADEQWGDLHPDDHIGQVVRTYRMGMDVSQADGQRVFGTTDDKYRDPLAAPATGDWVVVSTPGQREYPLIRRINHRDTMLVRRDPADRAAPQLLATNTDIVAIVHGADRPVNARRLWRALAVAGGSGADVVMVLTKADLDTTGSAAQTMQAAAPTVPVYVTASEQGDGLPMLHQLLQPDTQVPGKTMVLIGESGAGKSSLVNALVNDDAVAVGAVRDLDAKGRHTTTHRELIYLPHDGGAVLDTPGVRAIGMWPGFVNVAVPFADIAEAAMNCKFADCRHRNEPGCGVRQALADGNLTQERVDACLELIDEEAQVARELETKHWR
ncbi:ribosome small subunit-dependent GTPase A [Stomatohabitans albus]|uniref:ribosome small subunit-dependent GTPase A n=1 Tax=Stomatohabitans albus TaxID=3110766 RepID=UPI00300C5A88